MTEPLEHPEERRYEERCADILLRLDDWKTAKEAGATAGQMRSLVASELVHSSPDFLNYNHREAFRKPKVYRRTKAGDRAALLIEVVDGASRV